MKYYEKYIENLEKDEVFVFGSNKSGGFHGAGSAGMATFGTPKNVWREKGYDKWPHGTMGLWNVKGCAEGFQKGTIGRSYAIPTVTKPGLKCSISIEDISNSIKSFYAFAIAQSNLKFYVAQDAKRGLNGHSPEDMARAFLCMLPPDNVYFYKPFFDILQAELNQEKYKL